MTEKEIVEELLKPFWKSDIIFGESLFFIKKSANTPPESRLLFTPEKIISVTGADREKVYEQGKDYELGIHSRKITLPKGSKMPFKTLEEMYPPKDSELPTKIEHKKGDPETFLLFGEANYFHRPQAEITYKCISGQWEGYVPKYAGDDLPNSVKKLKKKQKFKICVSGDSISAGANASKMTKAKPYLPPYAELFALGLKHKYGAGVGLKNFGVGGWKSDSGVTDAPKVAAEKPDLVIIAYGMNDSSTNSPGKYSSNIKQIMDIIKKESPECEFILVTSMIGNVEWEPVNIDKFFIFRETLKKLCGEGVVLADMTSMWEELLKHKSFSDLTGNGVNHPNDFGHRIYAQVLLSLL